MEAAVKEASSLLGYSSLKEKQLCSIKATLALFSAFSPQAMQLLPSFAILSRDFCMRKMTFKL